MDVHGDKGAESDNEVPPDLLVAEEEDQHGAEPEPEPEPVPDVRFAQGCDDSENEVPPEFLAEHHRDEDEVE